MEKPNKKALAEAYKQRRQTGGVYSLTNTVTGQKHLYHAQDLKAAQNRFQFFAATGSVSSMEIAAEWKQYGAEAFIFEVLEAIEQGETQTSAEFAADIAALYELRCEKEGK